MPRDDAQSHAVTALPSGMQGADGVIYGADQIVARWVQKHIGVPFAITNDARALGVQRGGKMICGVVYDSWSEWNVNASIAATDPRWATRAVLRRIFEYPFAHVPRITVLVSGYNLPSLTAALKLGFQIEGRCERAYVDGSDLVIMRMFREECPWLEEQ